jgi:hypothetical protein
LGELNGNFMEGKPRPGLACFICSTEKPEKRYIEI